MHYDQLFWRYYDFLETLDRLPLYVPRGNAVELINEEKPFLPNRICSVIKRDTKEKGKLVFRGQKKENLQHILVKNPCDDSNITFYNHLFFFGEKAACFYSMDSMDLNDPDINKLQNNKDNLFYSIQKELKKITKNKKTIHLLKTTGT